MRTFLWRLKGLPGILLSVFVATSLLAPSTGSAQSRRSCYDCHKEAKEKFEAKKNLHDPMKDENCEACHKRHGFAQSLILQKPVTEMCRDCHEDIVAPEGAVSNHMDSENMACTACHDPHSSDETALLWAPSKENCADCHSRLAAAIDAEDQHAPFAEGNCSACHTPHASLESGLLVAPHTQN